MGEHVTRLCSFVTANYSEAELKTLCAGLGFEYKDLYGEDKAGQVQSLILWMLYRRMPSTLNGALRGTHAELFDQGGFGQEAFVTALQREVQSEEESYHILRIGGRRTFFDKYWGQLRARVAFHLGKDDPQVREKSSQATSLCFRVAAGHMLRHKVHQVPLSTLFHAVGSYGLSDDPSSTYQNINDLTGVFREAEPGRVTFVDPVFMRYAMARALAVEWGNSNLRLKATLKAIEPLAKDYKPFSEFVEVLAYLAIWSLPLEKGAPWQKAAFRFLRNLSSEQLAAGAINALKEMLWIEEDEAVLLEILEALKLERVGPKAPALVVGILCELARHEQAGIVRRAILALSRVQTDDPVLLEQVQRALVHGLKHELAFVRINAIESLVRRESNWAVELIIDRLEKDGAISVRKRAAQGLGRLGDARAARPLAEAACKDEDARVRAAAADALVLLTGAAQAVIHLVELLREGSAEVQRAAIQTMGKIKDAGAVESLIDTLGDPNPQVRRGVAEALGMQVDKRAIAALLHAAKNELEASVREMIHKALKNLGHQTPVDTTSDSVQGFPRLQLEIIPLEELFAGQRAALELKLRNEGDGEATDIHLAKIDDYDIELVMSNRYPKLGPGEAWTQSATLLSQEEGPAILSIAVEYTDATRGRNRFTFGQRIETNAQVPQNDFADFDLEIGSPEGNTYQVRVLDSPQGDDSGEFAFPFSARELERAIQQLEDEGDEELLIDLGSRLFEALFDGPVGELLRAGQGRTAHGAGLRLRLRVKGEDLLAVPWEILYDPGQRQFLGLTRRNLIVRHLEVRHPHNLPPASLPLRMLIVPSSPRDLPRLEVEEETADLLEAVKPLVEDKLLKVDVLEHPTVQKLRDFLMDNPCDILHFIGHGGFDGKRGFIALETAKGLWNRVTGRALNTLLYPSSVRLAVLNACLTARDSARSDLPKQAFLGVAPALADAGLVAVVAMQFHISDSGARIFAQDFYRMLARDRPIDEAVDEARRAIFLAQDDPDVLCHEWAAPVLFLRSDTGELFSADS